MIKNQTILEETRNERVYQLVLPADAPLGEIHDVLYQFRSFVVCKMQEAMNAEKPAEEQPAEEKPVEAVVVENQ